jgi:hypothetical protein
MNRCIAFFCAKCFRSMGGCLNPTHDTRSELLASCAICSRAEHAAPKPK